MDYYSILGVSREAPDFVIQADYSKMNDVQMATKANLNGLRELLKQWQIGCLLNSDLLQAMKEAHKS